ncbi:hypothetical protein [Carnobacterium pleistocenium]|uniref:hypothetical protein n=1 Tax=Carnobacterium pleistocenium TaxID=181073 RepID=UPI000556D10B|nr:hypothetical protein [Carnobacterium pleistocenium]
MEEHAESTPSTSESIVNAEKEAFILIKNNLEIGIEADSANIVYEVLESGGDPSNLKLIS